MGDGRRRALIGLIVGVGSWMVRDVATRKRGGRTKPSPLRSPPLLFHHAPKPSRLPQIWNHELTHRKRPQFPLHEPHRQCTVFFFFFLKPSSIFFFLKPNQTLPSPLAMAFPIWVWWVRRWWRSSLRNPKYNTTKTKELITAILC